MFTIEDLKKVSFHSVVVALAAIGRIFEFTTIKGDIGVKFKTNEGKTRVLCQNGDLCENHNCKLHHLHNDIEKISENYILCPDNLDCKDILCKYRHTNRCLESMDLDNRCYVHHPAKYQIMINYLISAYTKEIELYEDKFPYTQVIDDSDNEIVKVDFMDDDIIF